MSAKFSPRYAAQLFGVSEQLKNCIAAVEDVSREAKRLSVDSTPYDSLVNQLRLAEEAARIARQA